jgi:hypothetical protein
VGAVVKRLVYSSILTGQHCKSAADFVAIAQLKTNTIEIAEIEQHHIDHAKAQMEPIFQSVRPVPETKKIHSLKVLKNDSIEYKFYSNSTTTKTFKF